jgi:hypothetical protein
MLGFSGHCRPVAIGTAHVLRRTSGSLDPPECVLREKLQNSTVRLTREGNLSYETIAPHEMPDWSLGGDVRRIGAAISLLSVADLPEHSLQHPDLARNSAADCSIARMSALSFSQKNLAMQLSAIGLRFQPAIKRSSMTPDLFRAMPGPTDRESRLAIGPGSCSTQSTF